MAALPGKARVALHTDRPNYIQSEYEVTYPGYQRLPAVFADSGNKFTLQEVLTFAENGGATVIIKYVSLGDADGQVLCAFPIQYPIVVDKHCRPIFSAGGLVITLN